LVTPKDDEDNDRNADVKREELEDGEEFEDDIEKEDEEDDEED